MLGYKQTTIVPNEVLDVHLKTLTGAELKILLIIIRQTYGWIDRSTGRRKLRDRITYGQFITKTGLSRRIITEVIKSLVNKSIIEITCPLGKPLNTEYSRQGLNEITYAFNMCKKELQPVQFFPQTHAKSAYYKTKYSKLNTKLRENELSDIGSILKKKYPELVNPDT